MSAVNYATVVPRIRISSLKEKFCSNDWFIQSTIFECLRLFPSVCFSIAIDEFLSGGFYSKVKSSNNCSRCVGALMPKRLKRVFYLLMSFGLLVSRHAEILRISSGVFRLLANGQIHTISKLLF